MANLPRDDPLKDRARQAAREVLPARGIHAEKQVEGPIAGHASQHGTAGSDPVSAGDIGAAPTIHDHGLLKHTHNATGAPTVDDDETEGYSVGSHWEDVTNDRAYICLDATEGAAVWTETTAAGGGGANHNILSATHPDSLIASTVLGDIIHGNETPKWARLPGNITTTRRFLRQVGDGAISAVPAWDTIQDADIPAAIARDSELHAQSHTHGSHTGIGADDHHAQAHTHKVSKSYIFEFPDVDLAVGDFIPENAIRIPASGKHGTIVLGIGYARDEVVGTGTNTILVRTSTTLTGARTTRGTINLGVAREAQSANMAFTVSDGLYLWVECSAVGATAPQKVTVQVDAEETSYGQA